ncbi:MAG: hypothetical protein JWN61_561, partial [Pseudonocardiales bacterium]|nr:hypothetical protein [Pseudonocardiales bacterium]
MPVHHAAVQATDSDVDRAVRRILGSSSLRPGQREAIDAALARDTLAVLATGTGKSLVYRVVGAIRGGLTVVLCPTLSLQMDQLAALEQGGRPAVAINSAQSSRARRSAIASISDGEAGFALLAPEQLAHPEIAE